MNAIETDDSDFPSSDEGKELINRGIAIRTNSDALVAGDVIFTFPSEGIMRLEVVLASTAYYTTTERRTYDNHPRSDYWLKLVTA